ncbi:MAG: ribonuclease J, partial [Caulobacterales bacterium]
GEEHVPGVDVIVPDPTFLENERENILGIILTHAHEDHIGALGWLWPRLKAPVWATPFTAILVREKLRERGLLDRVKITEAPLKHRFTLGPFDIEYVTLTHSIPEPNGLAIRTPLGMIWHTGDWKIDDDPLIGEVTDTARLKELADEGVLAMVCDSTNVFVEGRSGSEAEVRDHLVDVLKKCSGKVAVTAFASNVARLETTIRAAHECGRSVCLVGRSMHKITNAAKAVGFLQGFPEFLGEEEAGYLPPENVLYLCTGSQGEARAALARIAQGDHRHVVLGEGDTVIFSSRVIPGNETAIYALYNSFAERGVEVITDREAQVHVSGHPCRDELKDMYRWARPRIAVPVHGERRHILEHVRLALEVQTPEAIAPRNGDIIRLAPGAAVVVDEVPSGRLYVDGVTLIDAEDDAIRERLRIGAEGVISVALAVSEQKHQIVSGPDVRLRGLSMRSEEDLDIAIGELESVAEAVFGRLKHADRSDDEACEGAIQRGVRKAAEKLWGKRPFVEVSVLRV